jgi:hypothetical protein
LLAFRQSVADLDELPTAESDARRAHLDVLVGLDEAALPLVIGPQRRRRPETDLLRVQDALAEGTPDREVLARAAAENRVLITNDRNTMVGFAYRRRAAGEEVPGVIVRTNEQSIGSAIDDILLIAEYLPEEEIRDPVVIFLPFRG